MIKTTAMILDELRQYAYPENKLARMLRDGEYIQLTKGLYETDRSTPGYLLAGSIYGPSYLSFEFALAYYGLIPEAVYTFTSATFGKGRKKIFENFFGTYTYRDVPASVYSMGLEIIEEGEYSFMIATREKALCDQLYKLGPVANYKELQNLLFVDLRIDQQELKNLNLENLRILAEHYPSRNVKKFYGLMRRMLK
jgi:predicted transcriptional regulator of viral defense system